MECKNCHEPLAPAYLFCPNCGAKVIRNRLSFAYLSGEIVQRFFNVDNTFLRTFTQLFSKPANVIDGYVQGVRKRYLNPIGYLGIALTLSGIFLFLLRKVFFDEITFESFGGGMNAEAAKKIMAITLDFSTFIFLLFIPLVTLIGWLIFNSKSYNITEYTVTAIYSLAHYNIFTFPISIVVCVVAPQHYTTLSFIFILIMAVYIVYVLNKLHGLHILRSLLFLVLFAFGFFALSIMLNLVFIWTGLLTVQDLVPPQ